MNIDKNESAVVIIGSGAGGGTWTGTATRSAAGRRGAVFGRPSGTAGPSRSGLSCRPSA